MRRPTGQRLWTRDYVLSFIVLLGAIILFSSLMACMGVYGTQRFGARDTAAGFASSSSVVGAGVVRLFIGKYLNFLGRKRTLLTNLGIFVACSLLYPLTDVFSLLIIIRVVQGAAFGIISTTVTATVLDLIPVQRRSEGLGYFSLAATLGTAIGPLAAVELSERASTDWVFGFMAICAGIGFLAVLPMRVQEHDVTPEDYANRWRIRGSDLIDFDALPPATVAFITAIGYSLVMTFLPADLLSRGMANAASLRSEERRVGKECRSGGAREHDKKKGGRDGVGGGQGW